MPNIPINCPTCGGSGQVFPHEKWIRCPACAGSGKGFKYVPEEPKNRKLDIVYPRNNPPETGNKKSPSPWPGSKKGRSKSGLSDGINNFFTFLFWCGLIVTIIEAPSKCSSSINKSSSINRSTPITTAAIPGWKQQVVKTKYENGILLIRAKPSLKGNIIGEIPNKAKVQLRDCCCSDTIDKRKGKWCYIKYGDIEGYAWGWYLF